MKIFERFGLFTATVAGAFFALAAGVRAEFLEGADPGCFYVRSCASPRSSSDASRRAASARAETAVYEEFLLYAAGENLKLPEGLGRLRSRLAEVAARSFAAGTIVGCEVVGREFLADGRARCTVKIPKENLKRVSGLDFRARPESLLDFCGKNPALRYEVAAILGKEKDEMLFGGRLGEVAAWEKGIFENVPETWFMPEGGFGAEALRACTDADLLNLWLTAAGTAPYGRAAADEFERRGLSRTAARLATIAAPRVEGGVAGAEFLKKLAEGGRGSALARRLVAEGCAARFRAVGRSNRDFSEASAEFAKKNPDYGKMISLLEKSLRTSVSDEALNLLGRAYEATGDDFSAAAVYAQATVLNPKTAYARANLAGTLLKAGDAEDAEFWANAVLGDEGSNSWSRERAKDVLRKIAETAAKSAEENTPAETPAPGKAEHEKPISEKSIPRDEVPQKIVEA